MLSAAAAAAGGTPASPLFSTGAMSPTAYAAAVAAMNASRQVAGPSPTFQPPQQQGSISRVTGGEDLTHLASSRKREATSDIDSHIVSSISQC